MVKGAVFIVLGGTISSVVGIFVLTAAVAVETVAGLEIASHLKNNQLRQEKEL